MEGEDSSKEPIFDDPEDSETSTSKKKKKSKKRRSKDAQVEEKQSESIEVDAQTFISREQTRIYHFREKNGKTIVTVAYKCGQGMGWLAWGATIWKQGEKDTWTRRPHTRTAINRLTKHPIVVPFEDRTFKEMIKAIRRFIKKLGVQSIKKLDGFEPVMNLEKGHDIWGNLMSNGLKDKRVYYCHSTQKFYIRPETNQKETATNLVDL